VHPSLIGGEDHSEFALEGCDLEVKAMLITTKDTDIALAELLVGRVCIEKMSSWCHVGVTFGPLNPDIAFYL
jgi:hypothetical protein